MPHVVIADIVRSGFVEGHHYGSAVALGRDGSVVREIGDVTSPMLPRSCNKPIQALAMLRSGLDLDGELLALACASHSGEDFHLDGVRRILAGVGLGESALQTPPDYPLDDDAREDLIRAGGTRTSIHMNCSGKHAAMLATCVANGWSIDDYLTPEHPLQQQILSTFAEFTGEEVDTIAIDGCGAPLLSTSLTGLARALARLAIAADGPAHRIAEAIRRHPEYVSGSKRDERATLQAVPGAIGKAGAESCYVIALQDGRAFATKTSDGAARVRAVVMSALLDDQGVLDEDGVDGAVVRKLGQAPLLGGDKPVGEIRVTLR